MRPHLEPHHDVHAPALDVRAGGLPELADEAERALDALLDRAADADWSIDAARIACPVGIVWGTEDRLLPWPAAAERLRGALPNADWVELEGAGHCPQLDLPLPTAQLILGLTRG